ncbi:Tail fiber protein [Fusobacterium necrophorum subsp. funduliforme]|uniref:hypothetical protein n=1 Tax=Fusobacterium necrophorum TaxID=859 RepID=UPI0007891F98|nr:hypothetical protein [Fusobacterium necrophorum]AYV94399.1 hypothetical protein BWX37_01670 [Fusobacterium necrophorum subsp. funduliforme]KYL04251.1 hypothetical protein A2J06_01215 [Fusobacterium necrophorum subsp. funduliforme]KYM50423.1 hypothetical protein A2U11_01210 [Fusobacterium necrophorum subsp. funduliforme]KYM51086.1 hypothetical protein A2U04_01730 [Fusobacterium necrophorum subsp. funduliforme]MDK4472344.1 hypothetical protein [Fusobacterium necrophorum]
MAEFNGQIVTNEGRNLLSRALAGQGKVIFTKAAFGDQKHSGNLREVTELKNKKIDLAVMNIRNDNGTAVLTVQISNENVEESFRTEEFGVYAKIENDPNEILYSYTTAVEADSFPSNKLGTTYESIHEVYMAISSDTEVEIHVREGIIFLTRDIANQVYTENGVSAVGSLKGRSNLEENKAYSDDLGHWYKNVGGSRSWNKSSTPDEDLIPMTWEYLFSLCKKVKDGLSKLKLTWESIENKPKEFPPSKHKHEEYEPKIEDKKSGYNLDKTDSYEYDLPNKVASGRALYNLWQAARRLTGAIELTWDSITGKPRVFPPQSHYHDDRYSRSEHVHDDRYAGRSHTHDDRYAKMNHDHDNSYASKWHSHSDYESSFSKNTAFNKNFGIQEGTVLEGKRMAEILGVQKYGGLITEYGTKYKDWAYYDNYTKEMFYCTQNNSSTSASTSYFKPFSNKAILNRLENLYKIQMVFDGTHTSNGYICRLPEGWLICNIEAYFGYQNSGTMTIFNTNRDGRIYDLELGGDGSEGSVKIKNNELYLNGRGEGSDMVIHRISVLISSN